MIYALWDIRSINLVADHDNLRDALALVLEGIERNGPQDTDTLALDVDVEDEEGNVTSIANGQALAELAKRELQPSSIAGEVWRRLCAERPGGVTMIVN